VSAQQLAGTDLSKYMNPFTNQVVNYGLNALDMQRQQALNQTGAQAQGAHAFGGSRQGVQEGITNAGAAMNAGQLAAGLQSQNFLNAQNMAVGDITRNYQADVANQGAAINSAGINLNAANQVGNLASQGQQSFLSGLGAAQAYQGQLQNQSQQDLNAKMQLYNENKQYPIDQLQILQGALSNSPYGNTVIGTQPGGSSNTAMQIAGLGMQGASMIPMFAAMFGGSDRRLKTDIKKVGTDKPTGLPVYAYRYKGDPKSYPKVVGPMAQDVAKRFPSQVADIGGRLGVGMNFLSGVMERANG